MAQAPLKVKKKEKTRITKKQQNPKKAAPKIIKPKNQQLAQLAKLSKTYSVTQQTEKLIASRVGHLELLKGSRRQIERAEKEKKKKEAMKGK
jgi:hypothetical protein